MFVLTCLGSPKYLQWLTFQEVGDLVTNEEAYQASLQWLQSIPDVAITWSSPRHEYIIATAPIHVWEKNLQAEFHTYEDSSHPERPKFNVAQQYSIPSDIHPHVIGLLNVAQTPPRFQKRFLREYAPNSKAYKDHLRFEFNGDTHNADNANPQANSGTSTAVTVTALNSYYHIPSNTGNPAISQSVFETSNQYFSPNDLQQFQSQYNLPQQGVTVANGFAVPPGASCMVPSTAPTAGPLYNCNEGNLDVQYITGVAQQVVTIYWYVGGSNAFNDFIVDIANSTNPPQSNSISWGSVEQVYH